MALSVDENDISAKIAKDRQIKTEWDLDDAELDGDIKIDLSKGKDYDYVVCYGWDVAKAIVGDGVG
jgi:hypothetical protein